MPDERCIPFGEENYDSGSVPQGARSATLCFVIYPLRGKETAYLTFDFQWLAVSRKKIVHGVAPWGFHVSLIWLEQLRHGEYIRHALEMGNCIHVAFDLTNLNGDGDLDVACGSFRDGGSSDQSAVTIWWNETSTP